MNWMRSEDSNRSAPVGCVFRRGFRTDSPSVRVLDLPFLFRNDKEIDLVHKEMEGFFAEQFRQKILSSFPGRGRECHLFSQSPYAGSVIWQSSKSGHGREIRSPKRPSPPWDQSYSACDHGCHHCIEHRHDRHGLCPPLGAIALQWNLYVKYMTSLPSYPFHRCRAPFKNFAQKIPAEHFKIIKDEFHRSMERLTIEIRKQTEESVALLEKGGIKILPMPQDAI